LAKQVGFQGTRLARVEINYHIDPWSD
jgi:hypothetical protein